MVVEIRTVVVSAKTINYYDPAILDNVSKWYEVEKGVYGFMRSWKPQKRSAVIFPTKF